MVWEIKRYIPGKEKIYPRNEKIYPRNEKMFSRNEFELPTPGSNP